MNNIAVVAGTAAILGGCASPPLTEARMREMIREELAKQPALTCGQGRAPDKVRPFPYGGWGATPVYAAISNCTFTDGGLSCGPIYSIPDTQMDGGSR